MSNKAKTTAMKNDGKPTLVPKLRFPEFRDAEGWEATPGDELFDQINNRQAPAGLPILAITQEHGAIPRDAIDYHVSVTEKSVETYKEVRPGDFIISLRSFQGGIEYSDYHGICSPAYVILRKRAELSDLFFKHHFKSHNFIQQLTKNLEGLRDGKMVSYKQFSELLLPNPTPPEQQKVAGCLTSLDDLIAAQGRKVDAIKTHKKGLMQQLFPREGESQPCLRFPEFQDAPEWKETKLHQIARPVSERAINEKGNDVLSLSGEHGVVLQSDYFGKKVAGDNAERYIVIARNDFVYNDRTTKLSVYGTIKRLTRYESGIVSPIYKCFRFNSKEHPAFWEWYFESGTHESQLGGLVNEGARAGRFNISIDKLLSTAVWCPAIKEQLKIADCLSSLEEMIAAQTQKLEALKTHKKGLIQQLFPSPEEIEA